ncbi:phage baseplate assembly protein V [Streptomyces sp. NPDC007929]|uniref:phage baseplate assembly protein V n=1 Tax=unclassified Streptomyces TaxID=2593676 RepID=UPI0036EFB0D8
MSAPPAPPAPSAQIRAGGTTARPLADDLEGLVLRAVVDSRRNAPTMIEVAFRDDKADVLDRAGIAFGGRIEVWCLPTGAAEPVLVGTGEVTAVEADCVDLSVITTVRAYDRGHRLQRGSRVRTFVNMTDADIAGSIAREAGLPVGRIEPTRTSHTHLGQMNQTDWEFLAWRCREIGYEFGVDEDGFFFRPGPGRAGGTPVALELQHNLRAFRPRVTGAALVPEAEMRVWDPLRARAVSTQADTTGPAGAAGATPAGVGLTGVELTGVDVAETLAAVRGRSAPASPAPAASELGPAPTVGGHIVTGTAPATGGAITAASGEALHGPAQRLAGSLAEAQATVWGDPRLRAGTTVRVSGPPRPFAGTWAVNAARHVFDQLEGGYRTHLELGTPADRTLLALTAPSGAAHEAPRVPGLVCGVVTDVNDPVGKGRVRVVLPWLAPDHETDWAPVVQAGGGRRAGALLLPEVGDQVLLGFELGDPRRPYVVGGVLGEASAYAPGGPAVEATGRTADVVRRGIVSPTGNMLAFHDKVPAGRGGPADVSTVVLGTGDGSLGLAVDQAAGTVTLTCRPAPPGSGAATGRIHIDCGDGGAVDISAGTGGQVTIDGGASLSLRARTSISIESFGTVAIKGSKIELN